MRRGPSARWISKCNANLPLIFTKPIHPTFPSTPLKILSFNHTLPTILEWPINLPIHLWDVGGNPQVHRENIATTQTTPQVRIKPWSLVLWGRSSPSYTTLPRLIDHSNTKGISVDIHIVSALMFRPHVYPVTCLFSLRVTVHLNLITIVTWYCDT